MEVVAADAFLYLVVVHEDRQSVIFFIHIDLC
jgi:hypothetical protein